MAKIDPKTFDFNLGARYVCGVCNSCSKCGRSYVNTIRLGCDHCFCEEASTAFTTMADHMRCCQCGTQRAKSLLIKEDE